MSRKARERPGACGAGRSRAARDSHAELSRKARERPGAWWWGPHAGVKRARAFAGCRFGVAQGFGNRESG